MPNFPAPSIGVGLFGVQVLFYWALTLKRNAYGFRSFYNFKLRIMIRHGSALLLN